MLNLSRVFFHLSGSLDSAAKGDRHVPFGTANHRPSSFDHVTTERDKTNAAHVPACCSHVVHDQGVAEGKPNRHLYARVEIQHFVSKTQHVVFPSGDHGTPCRSCAGEFVERQEGGSTCFVLGEPTDGLSGVFIGVDDDRGHARPDGRRKCDLVSGILWSAQLGDGPDDAR